MTYSSRLMLATSRTSVVDPRGYERVRRRTIEEVPVFGAHRSRLRAIALVAAAMWPLFAMTSTAVALGDTEPPTPPRLFAIRGLGACEIDMRIGLSRDDETAQSAIRYEVLSDGVAFAGDVVRADTRGSQPGFGSLDVFVRSTGRPLRLAIRAIDLAGNMSTPSNAMVRNVGACG